MQKIEFICDIGTVESYLGKWGKIAIFSNNVAEILSKSMREER